MKFDRCYGFSFLLFPSSSRFAYFFLAQALRNKRKYYIYIFFSFHLRVLCDLFSFFLYYYEFFFLAAKTCGLIFFCASSQTCSILNKNNQMLLLVANIRWVHSPLLLPIHPSFTLISFYSFFRYPSNFAISF